LTLGGGMESSIGKTELSGQELVEKVIELTEIPDPRMEQEVHAILEYSGQEEQSLTLEQLRKAMLEYLEELNLHFLQEFGEDQASEEAQAAETRVFKEK